MAQERGRPGTAVKLTEEQFTAFIEGAIKDRLGENAVLPKTLDPAKVKITEVSYRVR